MYDKVTMLISLGSNVGEVSVSIPDGALARMIEDVFDARLVVLDNAIPVEWHVKKGGDGMFILPDGKLVTAPAVLGSLDAFLEWRIRSIASQDLANVHSCGLIHPGGRVIAIVGTSGAGKTTLGLACSAAGMVLLGDEFGFLDCSTCLFWQATYPLCVRQKSWSAAGLRKPGRAVDVLTPLGGRCVAVSMKEVKGLVIKEHDPLPLGSVIVPVRDDACRNATARRASVGEWPELLMPSLDAPLPRDMLFRSIVRLFSGHGVDVLVLRYSDARAAAKKLLSLF